MSEQKAEVEARPEQHRLLYIEDRTADSGYMTMTEPNWFGKTVTFNRNNLFRRIAVVEDSPENESFLRGVRSCRGDFIVHEEPPQEFDWAGFNMLDIARLTAFCNSRTDLGYLEKLRLVCAERNDTIRLNLIEMRMESIRKIEGQVTEVLQKQEVAESNAVTISDSGVEYVEEEDPFAATAETPAPEGDDPFTDPLAAPAEAPPEPPAPKPKRRGRRRKVDGAV